MRKQELVKEFCKYYFAFQQIAHLEIKQRIKDIFIQKLDELKLEIENNRGVIKLPKQNTTISPEPKIEFIIAKDNKEYIEQYILKYDYCRLEMERLLGGIHSM